jgi:sugar/nucleoside kinase (ribokinase family)
MVDVLATLPGPLAHGSDTPAPVTLTGGGSAANTAAWVAAAGGSAAFVGRVGADAFGRAAVEALTAGGVRVEVGFDPALPTGTCVVLVEPDGERTMIPSAGANAALRADELPPALFAPRSHLHVSGYALFGGARPAALAALERARSAGMTVSVGAASAAPLRSAGADRFLSWIGTDLLLFANADEAAALTGREPDAAAQQLADQLGRVLITLGGSGALWCDGKGVHRFTTDPAPVVDSTGAGDAFAAGVLTALASAATVPDAVRAGHRLAAAACAVVGARPVSG